MLAGLLTDWITSTVLNIYYFHYTIVHLYPSGSCRELLGLQLHLVFPDSVLRETAVYTEGRSWNWFHVLEMYTSNPYFIRCYFQMPACTCVWIKDTYNAEVVVQILISPFASSECGTNTEEQSSWNMSCLGFQGQRRLDSESRSLPCSGRCTHFPRKSTRGTIIGAARWGKSRINYG